MSSSHWCKAVIEEVAAPTTISISTGGSSAKSLNINSSVEFPGLPSKSIDLNQQMPSPRPSIPPMLMQYYQNNKASPSAASTSGLQAVQAASGDLAKAASSTNNSSQPYSMYQNPSLLYYQQQMLLNNSPVFQYQLQQQMQYQQLMQMQMQMQQQQQQHQQQQQQQQQTQQEQARVVQNETENSADLLSKNKSKGNRFSQATGISSLEQTATSGGQQSSGHISAASVVPGAVAGSTVASQSSEAGKKVTATQNAQPTNLKEFVRRSFAQCLNDADRAYVTNELQTLIAKVAAEGRTSVHRWDLEPCPEPPSFQTVPPKSGDASSSSKTSLKVDTASSVGDLKSLSLQTSTLATTPVDASTPSSVSSKKRKSRFASEKESSNNGNVYGGGLSIDLSELPNPAAVAKKKPPVLAGLEKLQTLEEMKMREKRANRFAVSDSMIAPAEGNPQLGAKESASVSIKSNAGIAAASTAFGGGKKNKKNFALHQSNSSSSLHLSDSGADFDMESLKIVGTCERLEKDYLRLTSAPHPSVVRPESVLKKSIQLLKKKWEDQSVDYIYMCSQLKSIRQDLTVQHIQNDYTVYVYETHARIALESGDMNEYNQCQTQLKQLYSAGLKGNEMEFVAYRILYYVYLLGNKKYTAGSSDLAFAMASLTPEAYRDAAVSHALDVRKAIQFDNYHKFFKLYKCTPNLGVCILDLLVDNCRLQALQRICKGYKPQVEVSFVTEELAFDCEELCVDFLKKTGCVVSGKEEDLQLNTKDSVVDSSAIITQEKLLL